MQKFKRKGNHAYYIGLLRKFQGLGFTVCFDNPSVMNYKTIVNIEIIILFFKCWYTYSVPPKPHNP